MTAKKTTTTTPVYPIAPLTRDDVTFEVTIEDEDLDPEGHFDSGDADADAADVAAIRERLALGDETAWCYLRVTCRAKVPELGPLADLEGSDGLGGVSMAPPEGGRESGPACDRRVRKEADETFDMFATALADLNRLRLQAVTPTKVRHCTTRYVGATDTRGSHISASEPGEPGRSVRVSYDSEFSALDNHIRAAVKLFGCYPTTRSETTTGYVFTAPLTTQI